MQRSETHTYTHYLPAMGIVARVLGVASPYYYSPPPTPQMPCAQTREAEQAALDVNDGGAPGGFGKKGYATKGYAQKGKR